MTRSERLVLTEGLYAEPGYCTTTAGIMANTGLTHRQARTAVRRLVRRGLAELSPFFVDGGPHYGMLGGRGYTLTPAGLTERRKD